MSNAATRDPETTVRHWLGSFEAALAACDPERVAAHFMPSGFWRDMVAFTWNIQTSEGRTAIGHMLDAQLSHVKPRAFALDGPAKSNPEGWVEAWITFATASGRGKGHVRLVDGQCWTLLTTLAELDGHPAAIGRHRPLGVTLKAARGRRTWGEVAAARRANLGVTSDPYVVIIGGGQGGMSLGARLKHLGVPYLILEKNARAGDSWRNRYPSLALHDPVWYDHLPFIQFPPDWPVLTPRDRMGDWLEFYQRVMDLDYWTSATVREAAYDAAQGRWTVAAIREGRDVTLRPAHLVFATGMSGYPNVPRIAGHESFRGVQVHSTAYHGGSPYVGKRAVVIGSNTSAHDIATDLWEHDCAVTMVQRSGTMVSRQQTVLEHLLGPLYSEDALARGIDTETADYIGTTWPHRVLEQRHKPICKAMRVADQDLHDRLAAVGFMLDFGPDETGIALKSNREGGGFYIDVGAAELICNGAVKLAHGGIERLTQSGVVLADGRELPADLVVYATGYRSMNEFVADIVGREVADQVGRCWGVGSNTRKDPGPWEGELRNMWKPTAHEALWFQGGNLMQSRHFSRFLAMQLKARMEGMPVRVYRPAHPVTV